MGIWEVVRKYLLFWGVVFVGLTIYTVIRYGGLIAEELTNNIIAIIVPFAPVAIMIWGLWLMLRSAFR